MNPLMPKYNRSHASLIFVSIEVPSDEEYSPPVSRNPKTKSIRQSFKGSFS